MGEIEYFLPPWKHQLEAINRAKNRKYFALFMDMGVGKSLTAINILRHWCFQEKKVLNTLILCPLIVIDQWEAEIKVNSRAAGYVVKLTGTGKAREKKLKESLADGGGKIYITNYETLLMKNVFGMFLKTGINVLICDESHKLKSYNAKRTKKCTELADHAKYRLILTGTPILNTPMDIFSQYRILDNGAAFGNNFFQFRARYFYDANAMMPRHKYFPNWKPMQGLEENFNRIIHDTGMQVKKAECLDLPPLVKLEMPVGLNPEQFKAYKEMSEEFITYIDSSVAIASIALVKCLRLQQIISGHITLETGVRNKVHRFENVPRLKALGELLETITVENKVIVWAAFKENYIQIKALCEKLGVKSVEIHGGLTAKQKTESIEGFRNDPTVKVCIANQKAGGVGLNLIEASYSIYYSRTYSLEDDLQSEARNYRGGSEIHSKVTRIDLVTPGSIDQVILTALRKKFNMANNILEMRKQLDIGLLA